jgi:hypothetical protein
MVKSFQFGSGILPDSDYEQLIGRERRNLNWEAMRLKKCERKRKGDVRICSAVPELIDPTNP